MSYPPVIQAHDNPDKTTTELTQKNAQVLYNHAFLSLCV